MARRQTKTRPAAAKKAFETPLSNCLLTDPFPAYGATHDVEPFGVYQNDEARRVIFRQVLRGAPAYVPCSSPGELDSLIAKVFLAASKHAHRNRTVTVSGIPSVIGRIQRISDTMKMFYGPGKALGEGLLVGPSDVVRCTALPADTVLCVSGFPEEVGRLCCFDGSYGVSLMTPWAVSSIDVIPDEPEPVQEVIG